MHDLPAQSTPGLEFSFTLLALAVGAFWPLLTWFATRDRKATANVFGVVSAWMIATQFLAATGKLRFGESFPPPILPLFVLGLVLTAWFALGSPVGRAIGEKSPVFVLVGFHGFRLFLEAILFRAYREGLIPVQMTWEGRNFDVFTGFTAIPLAIALSRGVSIPKNVLRVWNFAGTILLINVVSVAVLSMPTPHRIFMNEPSTVWVSFSPYVWLPTVFVLSALAGHLLLFRKLR